MSKAPNLVLARYHPKGPTATEVTVSETAGLTLWGLIGILVVVALHHTGKGFVALHVVLLQAVLLRGRHLWFLLLQGLHTATW